MKRSPFRYVRRVLLQGLGAILPVTVTLAILAWLAATAESWFGRVARLLLPDHWYRPGMGIALGLVVLFGIGLLMNAWLFQAVWELVERSLERIPLVKTLYTSVKDVFQYISGAKTKSLDRVVMVRLAGTDMRVLGIVTRSNFDDLPKGVGGDKQVAVYFPMAYNVGGYTAIMPESAVEPIDMSLEEALRFSMTAGLAAEKDDKPPAHAGKHAARHARGGGA